LEGGQLGGGVGGVSMLLVGEKNPILTKLRAEGQKDTLTFKNTYAIV
jgi:hypothetical protein